MWTPADGTYTLTVEVVVADDEDATNDIITEEIVVSPLAYAWDAYASTSGLAEGPVFIALPNGGMLQIDENDVDNFIAGADMVLYDWYGVQYANGAPAPLVRINTETGELTTIGTTVNDLTGFAFDVTTSTAFALDFNGMLYTINLETAETELIGGGTYLSLIHI